MCITSFSCFALCDMYYNRLYRNRQAVGSYHLAFCVTFCLTVDFIKFLCKYTLSFLLGVPVIVPLNSATTLVSREYMECGSCQQDIAVINLRVKDLKILRININASFPLVEEDAINSFNVSASAYRVISEKEIFSNNFPSASVLNLVDKLDGRIEQYSSFPSYFEINSIRRGARMSPNDLIGGPVLQSSKQNTTYTVGMIRGIMRVSREHANQSSDSKTVKLFLSTIPSGFVRFIKKWLDAKHWKPNMYPSESSGLHPRYDCFLSYPFGQLNDSLCLCTRGWTNER